MKLPMRTALSLTPASASSSNNQKNKNKEKDEKEDDVKTTLYMPKSLLRMFKHFAADDDTNLRTVMTKALREYATKRLTRKNKD